MFLLSLLLASCSRIGQAQIAPPFTSIYQFSAVEFNGGICLNTDGADIRAGLVQDADGNLYGTASMGGSVNAGTVFKLTTTGVLTPLHNFSEYGRDGCLPYCHDRGLVLGEDGNLYGTTVMGGPTSPAESAFYTGTVFRITTGGAITTEYSFSAEQANHNNVSWNADGASVYAGLIQGKDGYLYGTAQSGGIYGCGTVFKVKTNGAGFENLHSFGLLNGDSENWDGIGPQAGLIQATDGNLYGTTASGGIYGWGTVFKITTTGVLTTLHSFDLSDGEYPQGGLIEGADGNLYGTCCGADMSSVFKITTKGVLTTLHVFTGSDGYYPDAGLIQGRDGNLYGTTQFGGTNNNGTVFQITTRGVLTTLYSFSGFTGYNGGTFSWGTNADGGRPMGALLQGDDGNLYGTTHEGGVNGSGIVFKLTMTPVIAGFSPASGKVGASVTLTGANFSNVTSVKLGSLTARITIHSDSSLTFTVPTGAESAKVTIINPFGTAESSTEFIVTH